MGKGASTTSTTCSQLLLAPYDAILGRNTTPKWNSGAGNPAQSRSALRTPCHFGCLRRRGNPLHIARSAGAGCAATAVVDARIRVVVRGRKACYVEISFRTISVNLARAGLPGIRQRIVVRVARVAGKLHAPAGEDRRPVGRAGNHKGGFGFGLTRTSALQLAAPPRPSSTWTVIV